MIDIYSVSGKLLASPLLGSDAERVEELMANDYVQLAWQSDSGEILPAGTYVMYEGERFSLLDPYEPEQKDEAEWSYRPQFQSRVMGWGKVPFFHYVYSAPTTISAREPDWTLTDTPANFMAAICRAIKNETGETWTYEIAGDLIGQSATISFAATDILSGLNAISGQFDTEWRADKATNTLYLGKAQFGAAITLEVDANVGVASVTRSKEGYYNRFYVYGSTRNITQDYQGANVNGLVNKRLTLDPAKFPGGHIDLPRAAGVSVYAKTLTFDEVYPHSGLTIANLRARLMYWLDEEQNKIQVGTDSQGNPVYDMYTIWFFQLPGFSLNDSTYSADNPDGMLIAGKALSIHFKSGALTGREFELIYHPKAEQLRNSDGQNFNVLAGDYEIKFKEESGLIIPMQTGIVPADGDEVIIFNLRMPAEYIATAYAELEATALKEIEERYTTDLNNYTVKSNPVAFADADPGLSVGRKVQYVNGDYSYTTRVIKLVRKLDVPSEQEITIGSEKIKGNTATLKEEVVSANSNIDILTQLNQLNQSAAQAYQRTQQMMLDSIAKMENYWVYDPANDTIWTPYNVLSRKEVTAYGGNGNAGGEDVPGVGTGATRLRFLEDVLLPETGIADDSVLTFDAQTGMWVAKQVKSGLDTSELAAYLREHDYARLSDIPALPDLSIYATQDWVTGKGYALASALDNYVTIATPQEVSGQKRFSQSILLGTAEDYIELSYTNGAFRVNSNFVAAGEVTAYGSADFETFGGARKLDDLTDVSLGAIAVGDVLSWDGAKWTNKTISQGLDTSAGDARWVLKAGDTMSGALNMAGTNKILLNGSDFGIYADNYLRLKTAAGTIVFNDTMFRCDDSLNGKVTLGGATSRWSNVYANTINVSSTAVVSNLNADMLDGYHEGSFFRHGRGYVYEDYYNGTSFQNLAPGTYIYNYGGASGMLISFGNLGTSASSLEFYTRYPANDNIYYRKKIDSNRFAGGWAYFVTSLNINSVTAGAANKLATARKLWGQSFDGSGDVNGHLSIGALIGQQNAGRAELSVVSEGANPVDVILGAEGAKYWSLSARNAADSTVPYGFGLYSYRAGGWRMVCNDSGYFGFGLTNPQYRVDVNGTARVTKLIIGGVTLSDDNGVLVIDKSVLSKGEVTAYGNGSSGSSGGNVGVTYNRLDAWADYTTDKAVYVLSAKLGYDLYSNYLSKTAAAQAYQPKGDYLTPSNYASTLDGRYVTLGTAQTISGLKTFGNKVGTQASTGSEVNRHAITPYGHTGGPWYINSLDTSSTAYFRVKYGTLVPLSLSHTGELTISGKIIKAGGTSSQFLKADGSVDATAYLASSVYTASDILTKLKTVDGSGSGLDADMLDGRHSYDYMLRLYSLAAAGSTLSYTDWLKTNGATFGLFARNSWGWGNSATITTPYGNLNTESYSALVFRQGNLNGAWAMAAAMFLPAYNAESKFIYIAQARTDGTAGTLVSPRMIRYADYDTVLASNVASASKLQTARSIYGVDFDGSAGVNGAFFWRATDATLRIYEATGRNSAEGVETLCLQSCFDGQDPQTSNYVTLHAARCVLALQPRGGRVAIGKTTADYPLDVNGTIAVNHPDYHAINLRRITSGAYGCSIGFTTGEGAFVGDIGFDGTKYFNVRNASGTTLIAALQNGNVGFGTTTPRYKADIVGDVIADGWLRTTGQRGWYNETYGGGLYMTDTTWVRIHNSKSFYSGTGYIRSDGAFDREGYGGASWNTGHGAYNVAISDNASQTPLLHAYRTGQAITATGANRLFAMELLNTGSVLRYCFGGAHKFEMHSNGNFLATGEVTAYSDERLKSGIEAITRGKRLRPVTFYKDGSRHVGLIAQEVQRLCPEAVSIGDDPLGLLSLNYSGALAYGFAGVYNELDSHETRIRELERDNQTLKRENEYLKMKISSIEGRLVA